MQQKKAKQHQIQKQARHAPSYYLGLCLFGIISFCAFLAFLYGKLELHFVFNFFINSTCGASYMPFRPDGYMFLLCLLIISLKLQSS